MSDNPAMVFLAGLVLGWLIAVLGIAIGEWLGPWEDEA